MKVVKGVEIPDIFEKEFLSANIIKAECGTTGYCGGDTGHGGRSYIQLKDCGCTDWTIKVNGHEVQGSRLEIEIGGDTELDTIAEAFIWIGATLKREAGGEYHHVLFEKHAKFKPYLLELMDYYKQNGTLKGMSAIRDKYKCTGITKELFFKHNLDKLASRKQRGVIDGNGDNR